MTAKKLIAVSALIVGATLGSGTTAFAQVYYNGPFGYSAPTSPITVPTTRPVTFAGEVAPDLALGTAPA